MELVTQLDGVEIEDGDLYCEVGMVDVIRASENDLDFYAQIELSDKEFDEYQGLFVGDKRRYLITKANTKIKD